MNHGLHGLHGQGAYYVAYLLLNPPSEPIHGMALALKTANLYGEPVAPIQIFDPATGQPLILQQHLIIPSGRFTVGKQHAAGLAGCLVYLPPTGITWTA